MTRAETLDLGEEFLSDNPYRILLKQETKVIVSNYQSFKVLLWTNMLDFYKPRNSTQIDESAAAKNNTHAGITKNSKMLFYMRLIFLIRLVTFLFKKLYLNWLIYVFCKTLTFSR